MTRLHTSIALDSMLLLYLNLFSPAQQVVATNTSGIVPPLVKFSGVLTGVNVKPPRGIVGVTFSAL